jgi:hypothetical protein
MRCLEDRDLAEWKIDLSPRHTRDALAVARFRLVDKGDCCGEQAQILHDGEWIWFGRTDLMDDVATGKCFDTIDALLTRVDKYLERGVFGARVRTGWQGRFFAVIDAETDG